MSILLMLDNETWSAIFITLKLSICATIILLAICIPLALWLARKPTWYKTIIESLIALPLVLPPTVLGFYLLILFNPTSFIGKIFFSVTNSTLVFNFSGLLIGSIIYSFPFVIRPLQTSFSMVPQGVLDAAATLQASPLDRFFSIIFPLSKAGVITGAVLGFTHTLGEFGVVLMIGGNIPGKTKTISIAIYDHVERLEYKQAHMLAAGLLIFSFIVIYLVFLLNKNSRNAII